MQLEEEVELGGERGAREVYEELLCDWPLMASDDASTLTEALPPNTVLRMRRHTV